VPIKRLSGKRSTPAAAQKPARSILVQHGGLGVGAESFELSKSLGKPTFKNKMGGNSLNSEEKRAPREKSGGGN